MKDCLDSSDEEDCGKKGFLKTIILKMEGAVPHSISFQLCVGRTVDAVLRVHACLLESCATGWFPAQTVVMNLQPAVRQRLTDATCYFELPQVMEKVASPHPSRCVCFSTGKSCSLNNGGCSDVCVQKAWGALCVCPVGYKLSPSGTVCEGATCLLISGFALKC